MRIIIQYIFLFLFVVVDDCILKDWCNKHIEVLVKTKAPAENTEIIEP